MSEIFALNADHLIMVARILGAVLVGGLIGLERSFHGRPAGFRTHALVCIASALLMLVTVYQNEWMTHVAIDAIRTDPTRMAQGIMTGIGFLGAGVIFKEGLSVRGLTTAASIWMTASIGILVGIGFWLPAIIGTIATLLVLGVFRVIENRLPSEFYAHHHLRFRRDAVMAEDELRRTGRQSRLLRRQSAHAPDRRGQVLRIPHGDPQPRPQRRAGAGGGPAEATRGHRIPHLADRRLTVLTSDDRNQARCTRVLAPMNNIGGEHG